MQAQTWTQLAEQVRSEAVLPLSLIRVWQGFGADFRRRSEKLAWVRGQGIENRQDSFFSSPFSRGGLVWSPTARIE